MSDDVARQDPSVALQSDGAQGDGLVGETAVVRVIEPLKSGRVLQIDPSDNALEVVSVIEEIPPIDGQGRAEGQRVVGQVPQVGHDPLWRQDGATFPWVGIVAHIIDHQRSVIYGRGRHGQLVQSDGGRESSDALLSQCLPQLLEQLKITLLVAAGPVEVYLHLSGQSQAVLLHHLSDSQGQLMGQGGDAGGVAEQVMTHEHDGNDLHPGGYAVCYLEGRGGMHRLPVAHHIKEVQIEFAHPVV